MSCCSWPMGLGWISLMFGRRIRKGRDGRSLCKKRMRLNGWRTISNPLGKKTGARPVRMPRQNTRPCQRGTPWEILSPCSLVGGESGLKVVGRYHPTCQTVGTGPVPVQRMFSPLSWTLVLLFWTCTYVLLMPAFAQDVVNRAENCDISRPKLL